MSVRQHVPAAGERKVSLYLCAFQVRCNKLVVGWHVAATMPEELVTTALQRAFFVQPPTLSLLVHSDRGHTR